MIAVRQLCCDIFAAFSCNIIARHYMLSVSYRLKVVLYAMWSIKRCNLFSL